MKINSKLSGSFLSASKMCLLFLLIFLLNNPIHSQPPAKASGWYLKPDIKTSVNYELKTTSSLSWKAPQQSIHVDQGLYGIYYITTGGIKYIKKDIREKLTTEKPILKGTKGAKRVIQVNLGNGFHAVYTYEWR